MGWPTSAQGASCEPRSAPLEDVSDVLASRAVAASWDPKARITGEAGRTTDFSLRELEQRRGALARALQLPQAGVRLSHSCCPLRDSGSMWSLPPSGHRSGRTDHG